jgi:hypothetical protein
MTRVRCAPVCQHGAALQILHHHVQPVLRRIVNHLGARTRERR